MRTIRQTSSATSTVTLTALPPHAENGRVTVPVKDDSPAMTRSSAISFGVLVLSYSTVIIRSRNVSAGVNAGFNHQPVRKNTRITGDGGKIAAGFTDPGCQLPGDGAFIDRCTPFNNFTIAGIICQLLPVRYRLYKVVSQCAQRHISASRSLRAKAVFSPLSDCWPALYCGLLPAPRRN